MRWWGFVAGAMIILALAGGCASKDGAGGAGPSARDVQEFHAAVADDDAIIVERLLAAKPALANARNEQGQTPLQTANQRGASEAADVLRRHGAKE